MRPRSVVLPAPLAPAALVASLALVAPLAPASARGLAAQAADTTRHVTVGGVVHDSLAGVPLAGATVQLVSATDAAGAVRTAVSDSAGRYAIGAVPAGRYMLGFLHPLLDSLGVEPPLRAVTVEADRPLRADIGTASPDRLRAAICGDAPGGVIVGVARAARDGAPAGGVAVAAEWSELSLGQRGISHRTARAAAVAGPDGWFAVCGVPRGGTATLLAHRGADSTGRVEVAVPAAGVLRRTLFVGPSAASAVRLVGTVVAVVGDRPLADAEVSVAGGPRTRTNARGEWSLGDVPAGTRMLDVRALGYYPTRQPVDAVGVAAPVRVALNTLRSVLDTVRVRARPHTVLYRREFAQRRRSGVGRYLDPVDIMRHRPVVASDVLRQLPNLRDAGLGPGGQRRYLMRGEFGPCVPAVYLDGQFFGSLDDFSLDTWLRPEDLAGIEVYSALSAPIPFRAYSGRGAAPTDSTGAPTIAADSASRTGSQDESCGSIVFWLK